VLERHVEQPIELRLLQHLAAMSKSCRVQEQVVALLQEFIKRSKRCRSASSEERAAGQQDTSCQFLNTFDCNVGSSEICDVMRVEGCWALGPSDMLQYLAWHCHS
jgi:hypothetical protein